MQPFGFFDYNCLQKNAFCVVSDSGTIPEEAAYFGFPAVSIRTSTERPEAVDKGVFTIGGISVESVLQAVEMAAAFDAADDHGHRSAGLFREKCEYKSDKDHTGVYTDRK